MPPQMLQETQLAQNALGIQKLPECVFDLQTQCRLQAGSKTILGVLTHLFDCNLASVFLRTATVHHI